MSFKKVILFLHRWLGLITGLVVLIVSITGCIFVFQKEINNWRFDDMYYVDPPSSTETIPLSTLQEKAQQALDGSPIYSITTHRDPEKAWSFLVYKPGDPDAYTYFGALEEYRSVYLNPYTGEVTGHLNNKYEFFNLVKYIHWSLLLSTPYGQPIVGWSTFIFVILLITGLVLWWPKRWTSRYLQRSFKVKWRSTWRRINYDLHNVFGFYALLVALVIALTGMAWSFSWFQSAVYVAATQSMTSPEPMVSTSDTTNENAADQPLDIAFTYAWKQIPEADRISVMPVSKDDKEGVIRIGGYQGKEVYYHRDALVFDQYSGELLDRKNFEDLNAGEKLIGMNYDIHVGAIAGLPGKIIAFLASLVSASLPVTGFIIWFDRERRKWERKKRDESRKKAQNTNGQRKSNKLKSKELEKV